ncbi:MAG TPA: UDP-N-acetylglucosamine--N-acetylmuramyl-(pentapeptide) pyrophosphoryl-undecaprenol N-acetylglucosamine transferase [Mycobacteriales bacterium]|nr:UDP-N-acetylglucosamine--N-acetylmuramyl-(pentapeptide) pyrophosphoryl-undecaprenol N-acetylglucosamine transferase [Mycobacteriales bacterium]
MTSTPGSGAVVLAGGGTAGHVEPALALADALTGAPHPPPVLLVGTDTGLETRLVPARGYRLATIPRVPLPRAVSLQLLGLPGRLLGAVRAAGAVLDQENARAVVGFGGYVALPVYLAARRRRIPIVVHEANARAGLANRIGARLTRYVATAHPATGLPHARLLGMPLRPQIARLDRSADRPAARAHFRLDPGRPVLLVTGGSQGARSINAAVQAAAADLAAAGVQVLHHAGAANAEAVARAVAPFPDHHVLAYVEAMELGYAAADLLLGRAGAMTCAEVAAVGLPAVYVPLPIGNGEQRLNAQPNVEAGGGLLVEDGDLDPAWLRRTLIPLLTDPVRLAGMSAALRASTPGDGAAALAELVGEAIAADGPRSAKMGR